MGGGGGDVGGGAGVPLALGGFGVELTAPPAPPQPDSVRERTRRQAAYQKRVTFRTRSSLQGLFRMDGELLWCVGLNLALGIFPPRARLLLG